MDSDLSLDFLSVVEQAAIACAHTMGQGDGHAADQAAVETSALMKGVRFFGDGVRTHSVVMQSQPARIRSIDTIHIQGERALVRF